MGRFSLRQISLAAGFILLACLVYLGFSATGRRLALAASRPFLATQAFFERQARHLFGNASRLEQENQQLREQLQLMQMQSQGIRFLLEENRQLRNELGLKKNRRWVFRHGGILTRDPAFWDVRFTIDIGTADGVTAGAPVLYNGVLIGRIGEVKEHCSVVDTIVSTRCQVSVMLDGTDIHGLLKGMGRIAGAVSPGCTVDFLPMKTAPQKGQRLTTSGYGSDIPPGIPVAEICPDAHGRLTVEIDHARKTAVAKPAVTWDTLKFVSVVIAQNKL